MHVFLSSILFSRASFQCTWLSPAIGQINHPGGTFYWLIISQLSFHEHPPANSFAPVITHTFKIFIIKRIRLCSLNIFFSEAPISRLCPAAFYFDIAVEGLAVAVALLPILHRADAASLFHAPVQQSLQTWCHWLLCKVTGNAGLKE